MTIRSYTLEILHFIKPLKSSGRAILIKAGFAGFALFFVLYIYKAYDIQQGLSFSGHSLLQRAAVFGFATFAVFLFNGFIISDWMNATKVVSKQWLLRLLWVIWEIFSGASLTFLIFNYFWNNTEWYWSGYFLMLFEYTCVVALPIYLYERSIGQKNEQQVEVLTFLAENGKHKISIKPSSLLYLKSEENYVEIFYLNGEEIKTELLRNSLKNILASFPASLYLLRCHRSFIVNPQQVIKLTDSGKKLSIELPKNIQIPVSAKYLEAVKELSHSTL